MLTADTDQLTETIGAVRTAAEDALQHQSADGFEHFEKHINALEGWIREQQQAMWADEAKNAIAVLEGDQPLSADDIDVIREFIVSDAVHYLEVENNYQDWLEELNRLMSWMADHAPTLSRDNIGEFRGVLKDAIRLIPDIRNYLEEQIRVDRFEDAIHNLDRSSRTTLAKLMREQLNSPNR